MLKLIHTPTHWVAVLALGVLATGCATSTPPMGSSGGRIDAYTTTSSDRSSGSASMPELLAFADRTSARLARDITDLSIQYPVVDGVTYGAVLELGYIDNQTNTPPIDFEIIQKRIRSQLTRSKLITDKFIIVEPTRNMDRERNSVMGAPGEDLLQEGGGQTRTDRYDPKFTYVLRGDFMESRRGSTRRYYFTFNLVNLQSRAIVFSEDYLLGQQ